MATIGLPKGSGKWSKVREKPVKSQGILKRILSGNPVSRFHRRVEFLSPADYSDIHFLMLDVLLR